MARIENKPPQPDSEMEEGEIVDELDDLSDISSEEEYLLRQRLAVLENYNNVLERKKAKRSAVVSGKTESNTYSLIHDLSDISINELEVDSPEKVKIQVQKPVKTLKSHHHRPKKRKVDPLKHKDILRKKTHSKKRLHVKIISETSDESDDEYRNRRRKLANAVSVSNDKNDKTSLKTRITNMLCGTQVPEQLNHAELPIDHNQCSKETSIIIEDLPTMNEDQEKIEKVSENLDRPVEPVEISGNANIKTVVIEQNSEENFNAKDSETKEEIKIDNSDEDLELLRQNVLKTKNPKPAPESAGEIEQKPIVVSEDEDSDTAELRIICLRSALLKKAIEMKQKQKLQKRLSQSSNLQDDLLNDVNGNQNKNNSEDNTDIESVDMDIGSDAEEKAKELSDDAINLNMKKNDKLKDETCVPKIDESKEDEFEEDEDLLRAKLLTSLSKNLPNLVDPSIVNDIDGKLTEKDDIVNKIQASKVPEEKRFIINLGDSDSEVEHEATKNLTKMHMELSKQVDFQQKLDIFLKSTRMEVEKSKLPDIVQPKPPEKFVAKAVKHLPKSEQMEYKNLVRRMAELEKMKQARQTSISVTTLQIKETLKPRNVTVDNKALVSAKQLDEQITLSRKRIADESAKILQLKEEGMKLSQKYKIVATELRNIATAITLNKRHQRTTQNKLSKIREQHQMLLKSSMKFKHSKNNGTTFINRPNTKVISTNKLQKENNPSEEEYKNLNIQKSLKVSVVNDYKEEVSVPNTRLTIQVDVNSNKKTVIPSPANEHKEPNEITNIERLSSNNNSFENKDVSHPVVEKGGGRKSIDNVHNNNIERNKDYEDDYKSPLDALGAATYFIRRKSREHACLRDFKTSQFKRNVDGLACMHTSPVRGAIWEEDPNAVLCPFEVGGICKDPDCKFLHPKLPSRR